MRIRAVVFDAGHTLLEMDYAKTTEYLRSRGHHVDEAAVTDAERRARVRLDTEQAMQSTRERTGQGRYVRYLLDALSIADDAERHALAHWRRGFNPPIGLCHQADREAASAMSHLEFQRLGSVGARAGRPRPPRFRHRFEQGRYGQA